MQIKTIKVPNGFSSNGEELIMEVDNETIIRILDFGSEEYQWTVRAHHDEGDDNYNPLSRCVEFLRPADFVAEYPFNAHNSFGVGATWFEEFTFAHAVMDVINNS